MEELNFIEFLNYGFIAVKGHINFFQFKEAAEEYLNEDEEDDLYIVDDIRHLYGKVIQDGTEEYWSWGYGSDEEEVVQVTVGEYFSALSSSEDEQSPSHIDWITYIYPN